jgi:hypothetical protein
MKPYYYVFNPTGRAPSVRHDTLEKAVKEAERLCALHPTLVFEVLQCVAITSAPKPLVSTFYTDSATPKTSTGGYIGFPLDIPLPEIPEGYRQAHYRGMGWFPQSRVFYGLFTDRISSWECNYGTPLGVPQVHYCEFTK